MFADIGILLANRGFRVFPLVPGNKPAQLAGSDNFEAATTNPERIAGWAADVPDADVGVWADENFCFLETDDERALREACADLPAEVFDTSRVSALDNRCYFVFRQTERTNRAGNMTAIREGVDNLFEFKQHSAYVIGPGSIHPETGAQYLADWRAIPAMPEVLLDRLCELHGITGVVQAQGSK